jgi:hypothetical protein
MSAQSVGGPNITMGIVRVIVPMHQMNRREIIKLVLQMSFLIMALRQYLLLGDWFGCLFLTLILLSLVISEN